jgi:hypothetical protein
MKKIWEEDECGRDFTGNSVARGLRWREFDDLPHKTRKQLVRLMARISEQSYRRGFQHGGVITSDRLRIDAASLRFDISLDESPFTDSLGGHTAVERLFMECRALSILGFERE